MRIKHILLAAVAVFLLSGSVAYATAGYNFEFYDYNTEATTSTFPFSHQSEVIVASQTQDVRNQLPINLILSLNGKQIWRAIIPNDVQTNCRGANGCSLRGPLINDPGANTNVALTATGKNGQLLATYTRNATQQTPSYTYQTTTKTTKPDTHKGFLADSSTWWGISYWWWFGMFFGLMWIGLWWFVGQQWWRLGFWNFRWPNPVWFFMPVFWFVPWFGLGLFGLLQLKFPWIGWWWLAFIFGWGGVLGWLYYGWFWKKQKKLIWRWPHMVWFLFPLLWFIPWFLWWPFGGWNLWWTGGFWGWWWTFPWGFWLPWWIVVYKEKEIWLWGQIKD